MTPDAKAPRRHEGAALFPTASPSSTVNLDRPTTPSRRLWTHDVSIEASRGCIEDLDAPHQSYLVPNLKLPRRGPPLLPRLHRMLYVVVPWLGAASRPSSSHPRLPAPSHHSPALMTTRDYRRHDDKFSWHRTLWQKALSTPNPPVSLIRPKPSSTKAPAFPCPYCRLCRCL
jgi:hypothetical protein